MTFLRHKRLLIGCVVALAVCQTLAGYAHFIRYGSRFAPFVPIPDRFDTASLPDKTVPLFIADQRRSLALAPGDTFEALVSQITGAARVWNAVETSDLRVAFSGLISPGAQMSSPWIEVSFSDEVPPGIVAYGGPVSRGEPVQSSSGVFTPIQKSVVILRSDLQIRPSYTERFFLTLVHELGHALGLQHAWTGGAMATEITRGVTRAKPLTDDDVAGISALYPARSFAQKTGIISGVVTTNGQPVHLASVVAIAPNQPAISALTAPDGSYRIEGVPQGSWYVYAHALPPSLPGEQQPVNLELPLSPEGRLAPGPAFDTVFWGGSRLPQEPLTVTAGQILESVNFAVQVRGAVTMHSVQTYSFFGQESVKPGHFTSANGLGSLVLTGYGVIANGAPAAGLTARILGAGENLPPGSVRPYPGSPSYMIVDVPLASAIEGPRHMVFQLNGETLVVPSAFVLTSKAPPSIASIAPGPDRTAVVEGRELSASTRILFDGVPATVQKVEEGRITVLPPPGVAGLKSLVTAENPDGQSSLFGASARPVTFAFESGDAPVLMLSPATLPSGAESLIEITSLNGRLDEAPILGGFSSTDVQIRRIWSTAPDKAVALVSVSSNAAPAVMSLNLAYGLRLATSQQLFQVQPAGQVGFVRASALKSISIIPGSTIQLPLVNVSQSLPASSISVSIAGRAVPVLDYQGGAVTVTVPAGTTPGLALLSVAILGQPLLPSALNIDPPPPSILGVSMVNGSLVSASNQPRPGDTLLIQVSVPADLAGAADTIQWKAISGSIEHTVTEAAPAQNLPGIMTLTVVLSQQTPLFAPTPLVVSANGRASSPVIFSLRP
jgi:hypothetical protein